MPSGIVTRGKDIGVANNAADSGNPIKVGGVYNSTPPTLDSADRGDLQLDVNGNLQVSLNTALSGEDTTNNRLMAAPRYTYSAVAVADLQVKASAGVLGYITISCNDSAPTAGSIIVYDNTAESGTIVFNHTFTTTAFVPFTVHFHCTMATGIYVGMTTTADVNFSVAYF